MNSQFDSPEPRHLWDHFRALSAIPRPSKQEEAAAAWVRSIAGAHGFATVTDPTGNVIVRVPPSGARADAPTVILQSHLDMVCEKNDGTTHDFQKDPIRLIRKDPWIFADGTTLGADNGIGVAAALAAATDPASTHGPLELLFTVDEETGLTGAAQLDGSLLQGKVLLNLDSEEDGALYIGCAGGRDTLLTGGARLEPTGPESTSFRLSVTGLRGGHSGMEIGENRGNAIRILATVVDALMDEFPILRPASFWGGGLPNAIPREAFAQLLLPTRLQSTLEVQLRELRNRYRSWFAAMGETVVLDLEVEPTAPDQVWIPEDARRLLGLLLAIPHGVLGMSAEIPGLVETSNNLASIQPTQPNRWVIHSSSRSSVAERLEETLVVLRSLARLAQHEAVHRDGYPSWRPDTKSKTLGVAKDVYRELWQKEPKVTAIHAGLECGLLGERIPGVDMVSLGPRIEGAHTPEERVHIESVERFWGALSEILQRLAT